MPRALALKGVRPRYRWLTLGEDHAPPTGSEFDSSESYTRKPSYKDSDGKFAQTCSLKFGWVLTAPIARCDAFEISDAVVAALSHQSENGALRVGALGHPSAAPHFNRAMDDLATPSPHAPHRHVDVADVEVIKPERDRLRRRLCEHAADGLSSGGEQLIWAHRAGVGLRFLPAEELAVESKRLLPVGGDQLMPADAAGRVQRGGPLLAAFEPLEQRNRCHLRVDRDRKAADVGDVRRRDMHAAAKLYEAIGGGVHVVDAHISEPARPQARFPRVLRQAHQSADRDPSSGEQGVGHAGRRRVLRAPADDLGVEGLGSLHVRRHQLVPDETAMRIGHVLFFSQSSLQRRRGTRARAELAYFIIEAATMSLTKSGNSTRPPCVL